MKQALHIFRKDVRYLRLEAAFAPTAAAAFAYAGAAQARSDAGLGYAVILLLLVWVILIARVIHAETLPGVRQFWITRPYDWRSLLAAKVLFVAAFVSLPLALADGVILAAHGFALWPKLPALLLNQALIGAAFLLPLAVIAALTRGMVHFVLVMAGLWALWIGSQWFRATDGSGVDWVRMYLWIAGASIVSASLLLWQYRRRGTAAARTVAITALVAISLGAGLLPWAMEFAIQTRLSRRHIDPASLRVELDSDRMWMARAFPEQEDTVSVHVPLSVRGAAADVSAVVEGLEAEFVRADGTTLRVEGDPRYHASAPGGRFSFSTRMRGPAYRATRTGEVRLRGKAYLTFLGDRATASLAIGARREPVPGLGLCSADQTPDGKNAFLACNSAFRREQVSAAVSFLRQGDQHTEPYPQAYSSLQLLDYAPLPAGASIEPLRRFGAMSQPLIGFRSNGPLRFASVVVDTVRPVAHVIVNFETAGFELAEIEKRSRP